MDISDNGKSQFCQVHDTVLDFLIYKSTEENFCALLRNPSEPDRRVRRLSLMGDEDQGRVEKLDLSHARLLIAFREVKFFPSLAKSNALCVLDLQDCFNLENHHVEDIGRLSQLRYLNVLGTYISELPRQIGGLVYLEALDARVTNLVELPESGTGLTRLVLLFVPHETKFPDGIGNMKNLQELGDINPLKQSRNYVEELGKLTNLKKLDTKWDSSKSCGKTSVKEENVVLFFLSIHKLETCNLATTIITFDLTENDATLIEHAFFPALTSIREIYISSGQLRWISKWVVSLVNLELLSTSHEEEIEQQDVEMVGSIPTLLKLHIWSTSPEPFIISSGGFQQLHELLFYVTNDFKKLDFKMNLDEFKSARGGRAGGFDFGIHHLSSLSTVRIYVCCFGVTDSDVEAAESAFKRMVNAHPNRPTLEKTTG